MKDYFDLYALAREGGIDPAILADAIPATFARRVTEVPMEIPAGLMDSFANEPTAQAQWKAFLVRSRLEARSLAEVIAGIRNLVLALICTSRVRRWVGRGSRTCRIGATSRLDRARCHDSHEGVALRRQAA